MDDYDALATSDLRRAVALHIHDLSSLAIGATPDATQIAKQRGVRIARRRAIAYDVGFRDLSYFNRTFRRRCV